MFVISNAVLLSCTDQSSKVRLLSLLDNIPSKSECVHTPNGVSGAIHRNFTPVSGRNLAGKPAHTKGKRGFETSFPAMPTKQCVETQEYQKSCPYA